MNKSLRIFILTLLLFSTASVNSYGGSNDSCVAATSLSNTLIARIVTLGFFANYQENFSMTGAPQVAGTTGTSSNPDQCDANYYHGAYHASKCARGDTMPNGVCTIADATGNVPDCSSNGGMNICYNDGFTNKCYDMDANSNQLNFWYAWPMAYISAHNYGDQVCADVWVGWWQTLGCKYRPNCTQFALSPPCAAAPSCSKNAYQNSQALVPITGYLVQCIRESVTQIFNNSSTDCGQNTFATFQSNMRSAVRAALILYIILFGIKMALGEEMPNKGEFFSFFAKFLLVTYFSVGFYGGVDGSGNPIYSDGISNLVLPFFMDGASQLSTLVYQAGGAPGLCYYDPNNYPQTTLNGITTNYYYLSLWDSIDCRILYYLGFDSSSAAINSAGAIALDLAIVLGSTCFAFLSIILAAFFGLQVVFGVFSIVFAVMFFSLIIYLVNITVISLIAMAILIYLAPLFVPMALFAPTKDYYESWLKLLISYALQPMVVAAYIAMMMTIFDQSMYGDCTFYNKNISISTFDQSGAKVSSSKALFVICDPNDPNKNAACPAPTSISAYNVTKCSDTLGYNMSQSGSLTEPVNALLFNITVLKNGAAQQMLTPLITLVLFAYLFYKFADVLGQFTAEVTGGTNLGSVAGRPMQFFDKAAAAFASQFKKPGGGAGGGGGASPSGASAGSSTPRGGAGGGGASMGAPGGGGGVSAGAAAGGGKAGVAVAAASAVIGK